MSTIATVALVVIALCQCASLALSVAGTYARLMAARQMQRAMAQGRAVSAAIGQAVK